MITIYSFREKNHATYDISEPVLCNLTTSITIKVTPSKEFTIVLCGNIAIILWPIVLLRRSVAASNSEHAQWDQMKYDIATYSKVFPFYGVTLTYAYSAHFLILLS